MPPKKDPAASTDSALLIGFLDKETKLIAAAFLSYVGPDKVRTSCTPLPLLPAYTSRWPHTINAT
jgi:hypothetical protein